MSKRDFLSLLDLSSEELTALVSRSHELKAQTRQGKVHQPLIGRTVAMIMQLSSTRTRIAFETGMNQLGGHCIFLNPKDTQLGRGEPIPHMAKVLSEMVDAVIIRTLSHADVETFADNATIPVINAMTSRVHPLQLLADVQTFEELKGNIAGKSVAFVGDGYNMCHSYINAARQWGFNLKIASPETHGPDPELLASTDNAKLVDTPAEAVASADLVVTDVWSSIGHEEETEDRRRVFADYQVNESLLDLAPKDVIFMHCLPAHPGEEISETLLDDPRSVAWQEAGNRLHTQKALLEKLLT